MGERLHFDQVRFGWPGATEPLLDGFDLEVAPSKVTVLVGESGCGKSTVLRLAVGLLTPLAGTVLGGDAEARAFVFQSPNLLPWRTVADNVALPLELQGKTQRGAVDRALAAVGLFDAADALPGQLSGGMRMRASLARALVVSPGLLVLDEPFSALDAITRRSAWSTFQDAWREHGSTVLMVTHDIDEAVLLGDRVVVVGGAPLAVRGIHTIDIPQPRPASLRHDPRVARYVADIEATL